MSFSLIYPYDGHTDIIAEVSEVDKSFDHAFGTPHHTQYEAENLAVVVYIGGIDYDITKALTDKQKQYFEEWLLNKFASEEER